MKPLFKKSCAAIAVKGRAATASDKLMLQLARILIVAMLPVFGFLVSNTIGAMNKTIEKISDTQEQMAVMLARVDESVRHIEQRLDRIEP